MSVDVTCFCVERIIKSDMEHFLCALQDEIERKYMDAYLSEFIMDAKAREKVVEGRGFCNHHSYKMLIAGSKPESPDGHGIALIAKSIIEKIIHDLRRQKKKRQESFRQRESAKNRPACTHLTIVMEIYYRKIVELLSSPHEEFLKLFKNSKGLYIPHFIKLLKAIENATHNQSQDIIEVIEVEEKKLPPFEHGTFRIHKKAKLRVLRKRSHNNRRCVVKKRQKIVGRRGKNS